MTPNNGSYNGVDVISILSEIKDLLLRHGGHQNAAGLEFKKENLEAFKERFNELVPVAQKAEAVLAEGVIDIHKLGLDQIADLDQYDLKDALFVFEGISPHNKYLIRGEHTKLIISHDVEAIFFSNKALYQNLYRNKSVNLLGRLDINTYQGRSKKQILIDDYDIM